MRYGLAVVALLTSACSGSPTAPAPPTTPTPPAAITLTVHVTATNGGQPLAGVSGDLSGQIALTNADGGLQYQVSPGPSARLSLTGSGIVPRSLMLAVAGSRDVTVDAISSSGFDLNFYRQLVRNAYDAPGRLEPLRRWTVAPQIYLKTVDEAGAAVDARTLETTERVLRETAAAWTAGRFGLAGLERGAGTRAGSAGWITVRWQADNAADRRCGQADVGLSGGTMDLFYKQGGGCRCAGVSEVRPLTVRHELGHSMGFWHTESAGDLMSALGVPGCDQQMSARELAAAAVAYSRPVGNTDPDVDPAGAVTLAPMSIR